MAVSGMKAIRDLSTLLPILTECLETLIFPLTDSAYQITTLSNQVYE